VAEIAHRQVVHRLEVAALAVAGQAVGHAIVLQEVGGLLSAVTGELEGVVSSMPLLTAPIGPTTSWHRRDAKSSASLKSI
jgi:hypothetical protein